MPDFPRDNAKRTAFHRSHQYDNCSSMQRKMKYFTHAVMLIDIKPMSPGAIKAFHFGGDVDT